MQRKSVLIVEDNAVQTEFFKKIISKISVKSHLLSEGSEVVNYLNNHKDIGLILLDLALPDISGMQVLEELKKTNNHVPVVIISATEDVRLAVKAVKLGAEEFFIKNKEDILRLCEYIDNKINSAD